jgi:hypothetical protein
MTRDKVGWVAFNAMLVVFGACIAGMPYNEAQKLDAGRPLWFHVPGTSAMWELAHMEGLVNAIFALAVAAVASQLKMSPLTGRVLMWALIADAWGNFLGAVVGALDNVAVMDMNFTNGTVAFLLFDVAAVGAVVAIFVVARAGFINGRSREDSRSSESSSVGAS